MKIVFFDGYCSVCNTSIDWLIRRDSSHQLKFASLQGETASRLLYKGATPTDLNTVVYLREGEKFEESTAVLNILGDVGGIWKLARILLIAPKFLRDTAYRLVARNRYRLFKKRETCRIPTPHERERLLP